MGNLFPALSPVTIHPIFGKLTGANKSFQPAQLLRKGTIAPTFNYIYISFLNAHKGKNDRYSVARRPSGPLLNFQRLLSLTTGQKYLYTPYPNCKGDPFGLYAPNIGCCKNSFFDFLIGEHISRLVGWACTPHYGDSQEPKHRSAHSRP